MVALGFVGFLVVVIGTQETKPNGSQRVEEVQLFKGIDFKQGISYQHNFQRLLVLSDSLFIMPHAKT
jgi:hypothetical protein